MRRAGVRRASGLSFCLVLLVLSIAGNVGATSRPQGSLPRISEYPSLSQVTSQILAAETVTKAPASVRPPIGTLANGGDFGMQDAGHCASPGTNATSVNVGNCTFGDKSAKETLVLTGDSRAQMWLDAFETVATGARVKLVSSPRRAVPLRSQRTG